MIYRLKFAIKYILYRLFAKHKKGHGIHSPFIYELIRNVFNQKKTDQNLNLVIDVYKKYIKSKETITFTELGAGSLTHNTDKEIYLGKLIQKSSINKKYGTLIYNLIRYFNPSQILEIGTSVGISAAFIAQAAPKSNFISIEGVEEKINMANRIADELNQSTKFITGNFENVLSPILKNFKKLDFVFFDGNHTKESTLEYFHL